MSQPRWLTQLEEARQAGIRGFILTGNTSDLVHYEGSPLAPCQVRFFLAQWLDRDGYDVYLFSLANGLQRLRNTRGDSPLLGQVADPRSLEQVLSAFGNELQQRERRIALIVDYADHLCPISQGTNAMLAPQHLLALETFHTWGTSDRIRAAENLIFLISHENQVNDLLVRTGSGYRVIWIDLPNEAERRSLTALLLQLRQQGRARDFADLDMGLSLQEFLRMSGGLRLRDIEGLFRQAAARGTPVTRALVRDLKAEVIRQMAGGLLEVKEPSHGLEQIAGLPHLKVFVQRLKRRWHAGATDLPQAILLAGVPGCGKSFSVIAIAYELQVPCLAMRNVREQWVGASERNLERVLQIIETLAPCLVWIDELDQAIGQRTTGESADAGTSERMMARLWEFMGAMRHRGRILWVATTNRPDLLDAATLDRFPIVIPMLHPTPKEVGELLPTLRRWCDRQGIPLIEDASQAMGAECSGRKVGAWGDLACFSLTVGKPLTTGEGGIILTPHEALYERLLALCAHPLRQQYAGLEPNPFSLRAPLNPLGVERFLEAWKTFPQRLQERQLALQRLNAFIEASGLPLFPVQVQRESTHAAYRLCPRVIEGSSREEVVEALQAQGWLAGEGSPAHDLPHALRRALQAGHWRHHPQALERASRSRCPNARRLERTLITLEPHPNAP